MRGEHLLTSWKPGVLLGSSPHARGARNAVMEQGKAYGIIPACAGSTLVRRRTTSSPRDHPRMRGEHILPDTSHALSGGSSPHARGALGLGEVEVAEGGIIPACAGSTVVPSPRESLPRNHPRMRGEHWGLRGQPWARGGIIPACAGSTCGRDQTNCAGRDHPRMRGEHGGKFVWQDGDRGSSPHARGARGFARDHAVRLGIIPACAGSTCDAAFPGRWGRDHPRMRGEHKNLVC